MQFYGEQPEVDLTYSDVFLVPRRLGGHQPSRRRPRLRATAPRATIPLVSANMNSVTGARLAATLARRGGLGVLPQDMPLQELDAAIRWVKAQPVRWDTPLVLPPEATVADAARTAARDRRPRHRRGRPHGGRLHIDAVLGVVPATRLGTALPDARLGDLARGRDGIHRRRRRRERAPRVRPHRRRRRRDGLRAAPRLPRRHAVAAQRPALHPLPPRRRRLADG